MTNFSVFSINQLQTSLALLRSANSLQELCKELETEVARRTAPAFEIEAETENKINPVGKKSTPCPTPGCPGTLTRWETSTREVGSLVIGCRLCWYSRVEGPHNA